VEERKTTGHGTGREAPGTLLVEALAALAVLGFVAVAAGGMGAAALRGARLADDHAAARRAAVSVLARAAAVSWARVPAVLGGTPDDTALVVSSSERPDHELLAGLARRPSGAVVRVRALGLAPGGLPERFRRAVAIRLSVRVTWQGRDGREHRVSLVETRF